MSMFLKNEDYSVANCLFWGVCAGHMKEAMKAQNENAYGRCIWHAAIAGVEFLPGLGQIVSLAEAFFVRLARSDISLNCIFISPSRYSAHYRGPVVRPVQTVYGHQVPGNGGGRVEPARGRGEPAAAMVVPAIARGVPAGEPARGAPARAVRSPVRVR